MHIQFSLIKDGKNVFESQSNHGELSQEAYYFIGGLLAHSKEMALITNPIVNSYKRLVPGYDAPTELTWTENNQNSLVRIPVTRGEGIRVELRSPDTSANPYVCSGNLPGSRSGWNQKQDYADEIIKPCNAGTTGGASSVNAERGKLTILRKVQ